jgi:hypothetical protein
MTPLIAELSRDPLKINLLGLVQVYCLKHEVDSLYSGSGSLTHPPATHHIGDALVTAQAVCNLNYQARR